MCECGCNTCKTKPITMMLNESIAPRAILSEGLKYHLDNGKPLTEHLYRAGSPAYFNLWAEARALYSRGIIEVYGDDKELITETNLGEFGILEDGTRVPLDFPMLEEQENPTLIKEGTYEHAVFELNKAGLMDEDADYGGLVGKAVLELIQTFSKQGHSGFSAGMVRELFNKLSNFETLTPITSNPQEWNDVTELSDGNILFQNKRDPRFFSEDMGKTWWNVDEKIVKESLKYVINTYKVLLTESKKKKDPPIGKPKRGGSKKFYVYVRDPKTKKIKKVSFGGTTGLSVKINDPKARQAFAKRHDCKNKKDRTKPSYWSCRIGRYWKQLGGDKNFSGFW